MSEIFSWFFWCIGVFTCAVIVFVGSWLVIGAIVETLTEAARADRNVKLRVADAQRWLSGFKDLDVIWNYLHGLDGKSIDAVRTEYAKLRGTNVYGVKKNDQADNS